MPSADYNRELALPSDELVSLRRRRNLRRQRRETSSQLRSPSSGMSPAEWTPKRSVRGGLVARALWIRPKPKSGTSCADDLYFSEKRRLLKTDVFSKKFKSET